MESCRDARWLCLFYPGRIIFLPPLRCIFHQLCSEAHCNARAHAEVTRLKQLPGCDPEAALHEEAEELPAPSQTSLSFQQNKNISQYAIICLPNSRKLWRAFSLTAVLLQRSKTQYWFLTLFSFYTTLRGLSHSPPALHGRTLFWLLWAITTSPPTTRQTWNQHPKVRACQQPPHPARATYSSIIQGI